MKLALIVVLVLLLAIPGVLFFLSQPATLDVNPTPRILGSDNTLSLRIASPNGLRRATALLEQANVRTEVAAEQPASRFMFWRKSEEPVIQRLIMKVDPTAGFKTGPAKLTVSATANNLRAPVTSKTFDVQLDFRPPVLSPLSGQHYINQGGSETVVFRLNGYFTEAGVKVGNTYFRSHVFPGQDDPNYRFSFFAFPWDTPESTVPMLYARGPGGAEVTSQFWYKLFPKKFRSRTIVLDDRFLQKVVGELDPNGSGDTLSRFLKINGAMRRDNNATLAGLKDKSEHRILWKPPFQQLSNSQVEAQFADVRTYEYQGKKVDQQVHLGFDLSVTANVPVVASNDGRVVWADPLGIYGNCVVIDHGYTLQSIYAHLSQIGVKVGDDVRKGQELGRSGMTGLAAGDHLHFSMQLDGVQINPVEWWDAHWLQDRVLARLSPSSPSPAVNSTPAGHTAKAAGKSRRRR